MRRGLASHCRGTYNGMNDGAERICPFFHFNLVVATYIFFLLYLSWVNWGPVGFYSITAFQYGVWVVLGFGYVGFNWE